MRGFHLLCGLVLVFACAGVAPAATTFQLQNVVNRVEVGASAGDFGGFTTDGPYYVDGNPAEASATASKGSYTGHGDAHTEYDESPDELSMVGTGNASGGFGVDGGATGGGRARFSAEQDFGPGPVLVHIVGTFYLEHSPSTAPPQDNGDVSFTMRRDSQILYSRTLDAESGTLTFDDLVAFEGNIFIEAALFAQASGAHTDAVSYDVTLTIVPEPAGAMLLALAATTILRRGRST